MNSSIQKTLFFLALSFVLFGASFLTDTFNQPESEEALAEKTSKAIAHIIADFEKTIADDALTQDIVSKRLASVYLSQLREKPYKLLVYKGSELIFWSDNHIIPMENMVTALTEKNTTVRLSNGYYEIAKNKKIIDGQDYSFVRLILLKGNYSVQNNFLTNSYHPLFGLPGSIIIKMNHEEGGTPVKGVDGNPLFQIELKETFSYSRPNLLKIIFSLLSFIALLFAIFFLVKKVASRDAWTAFLILIITFTCVRWLTLILNLPPGLYDFNLFNPQLYASSAVNKSLGDLSINLLMIFWIIVFFYRQVPLKVNGELPRVLRWLLAIGVFYAVFFLSRMVAALFSSLLLDSKIPFDFNDFLSLNIYSFICLGSIMLALVSYALISAKFIRLASSLLKAERLMQFTMIAAFALYLLTMVFMGCPRLEYFAAGSVLLLMLVLQRMVLRELNITALSNMIAIIVALSVFSSIYLYHFNELRELDSRKALARKLSVERDLVTEYLFLDLQDKIFEDLFIINYFRKPFISTQEIIDRVKNKYFSGFFRKYDVNVYALNTEGRLLRTAQDEYLELLSDELLARAQQTLSDYLFYIPKQSGSFAYISNLPVIYRGKLLGSVVLELKPKTYSQTNLYPELLLEEKVKPPEILEQFSYALYSFTYLVRKGGNYAYPFEYSFAKPTSESPEREFQSMPEGDLEHLIYFADEDKQVVVTGEKSNLIEPIALFSYLFCIYLLFGLAFVLIRYGLLALRFRQEPEKSFSISFRDKIQFSMIFIIIFSFFVIGYFTILHFVKEYDKYHSELLVRKSQSIRTAIEYILKEDASILLLASTAKMQSPIDLAALSDIHGMDINVYSPKGLISNTSQPEIFEKGLLSEFMEPSAFGKMTYEKKTQYIQTENIGSLSYLAIYTPIKNNEGELLAYLNLPYFAKERELNREISSLLVTLVNVYVLLLVIAGFLAYLLSDSVTRSLTAISEKLKLVKLGKKNEPIEWNSNDEIGTLVAEYNKMIQELERSAELLARSERESAWREMAKQIAHEIKNPLTPMKLSIQHLQRAMASGDPKAPEMAKKMSVTLIEQIENLAHIATEFSNFAKMPRAQNEVINLTDVIESVVNLFNEEKHLSIHFDKPQREIRVLADKNQLLSAFNNLVKNASQSIPFDREGKVEIRLISENGSIITEVKDNGIGIPDEQQEKVFVPNFTTKSGGTGLGLALTRQIIENAKGRVWFESNENIGTSFYVELPEYG